MLIAFHKPFGVLSQFTSDRSSNRTLAEFGFPKHVYPIGRLDADSEGLLLLSDEPELNECLLHPRHAHKREYWAQVERTPALDTLKRLERGATIQGRKTLPCRVWILNPQPEIMGEFSNASDNVISPNQPIPNPSKEGRQTMNPCRKFFSLEGSGVGSVPMLPPRDPPIRFRKTVPTCWIGLELTEGKNRQVRRMTAAIGHPTLRLVRVRIGGLRLGDLPAGTWQELRGQSCQTVLQ